MKHSLAILLIFALMGCGSRTDPLPASSSDPELSASEEAATRQWRRELALVGQPVTDESLQAMLHKVEQSSFQDAYRLWREVMDVVMKSAASSKGSYTMMGGGVEDSKTGKFIPGRTAALQCRLGQEAHLQEPFLLKELAADANVYIVLESSQRLCEKYGISMSGIEFIPGQGYTLKTNSGCSPQAQQAHWLKAMSKAGSQPDGAANESQPIRSVP